jgi:hypothetical protein
MQGSTSSALTMTAAGGLLLCVAVFALDRGAMGAVAPKAWLVSLVAALVVRVHGAPEDRGWANLVLTICILVLLAAIALVILLVVAIGQNGFPP